MTVNDSKRLNESIGITNGQMSDWQDIALVDSDAQTEYRPTIDAHKFPRCKMEFSEFVFPIVQIPAVAFHFCFIHYSD